MRISGLSPLIVTKKYRRTVTPELAPEYLSGIKCRCIASVYDLSVVIGCDTVVICDGEVLGKPVDEADAIRMLKMLSGKTHHVVTGVTPWQRLSLQ